MITPTRKATTAVSATVTIVNRFDMTTCRPRREQRIANCDREPRAATL
jgi:hypothetical protein